MLMRHPDNGKIITAAMTRASEIHKDTIETMRSVSVYGYTTY